MKNYFSIFLFFILISYSWAGDQKYFAKAAAGPGRFPRSNETPFVVHASGGLYMSLDKTHFIGYTGMGTSGPGGYVSFYPVLYTNGLEIGYMNNKWLWNYSISTGLAWVYGRIHGELIKKEEIFDDYDGKGRTIYTYEKKEINNLAIPLNLRLNLQKYVGLGLRSYFIYYWHGFSSGLMIEGTLGNW
jgi:hypothetical protein